MEEQTANPHQVAADNEMKVLQLLRDFGHLRRHEIGLGVWPNSSASSADQMTRRTIKRMLDKKLIIFRRNSYASDSFILGKAGVSALKLMGIPAVAGYNIQSVNGPQFYHRTLGSIFLLLKKKLGAEVYGEYALMQDWCPLTRNTLGARFKKMPDGLILWPGEMVGMPDVPYVADWVEVESNYKPKEELQRVLDIGWKSGEWLDAGQTILLDKLYLVYNTHIKNHESAILRAAKAQIREKPMEDMDAVLSSVVLVRASVKLPLTWESHEELSLLDLGDKLTSIKE